MNYNIRKADKSDTPVLEELLIEMLKTIYNVDNPREHNFYNSNNFEKFFLNTLDICYVVEYENSIIAFLTIEDHKDYLYLDDLAVTKAYRNKGIGTKLISEAEGYAQATNINKIVFHVEKTNQLAYQLYLRLGYTEDIDEGTRIRMCKII